VKREELIGKGLTAAESLEIIERSLPVLEGLEEFTAAAADPPMRALVGQLGRSAGQVFGILRVAVTGQKVSPPLFESMEIIGKETVIARLREAAAILGIRI
jgi:glutamyl-tRNA synthetase